MNSNDLTRERIMQVAKEEFGLHGFKLASTNAIFPKAKVSKGLIFKIFGSKAELFYAVFVAALDSMLSALNNLDTSKYDDIFEKIVSIILWKFEYSKLHPYDTSIMLEAIGTPPKGLEAKIALHLQDMSKLSIRYFFDEIKMENICDDFTREDVMNYLEIAISGLQAKYINRELSIEYMNSIKDESIRFLKLVLRGMEK